MSEMDYKHMKQAFTLALKGLGYVAPNPLVGCVIVKDNEVVSEGYHQAYGEAHAEVNAITNLPSSINPKDCTLYVNLEPCAHTGKTGPCANLIIEKGFKKVVISNLDSNPLVSGKGIKMLEESGIEVISGVLEQEGRFLNRRFFTFHEKKRPYIILKWAQTADGFISKYPLPRGKEENWITGNEAKKLVHRMRAEEESILVGKNTVVNDNPELTTRLVPGRHPVRIVIAEELGFDSNYQIFNSHAPTLVFNCTTEEEKGNVKWIKLSDGNNVLDQILNYLYSHHIASLIVEGGAETLESFIKLKKYDEIRVFVNPNLEFESGKPAPKIALDSDYQSVGEDHYFIQYV